MLLLQLMADASRLAERAALLAGFSNHAAVSITEVLGLVKLRRFGEGKGLGKFTSSHRFFQPAGRPLIGFRSVSGGVSSRPRDGVIGEGTAKCACSMKVSRLREEQLAVSSNRTL